jgi:hypothetical protein
VEEVAVEVAVAGGGRGGARGGGRNGGGDREKAKDAPKSLSVEIPGGEKRKRAIEPDGGPDVGTRGAGRSNHCSDEEGEDGRVVATWK